MVTIEQPSGTGVLSYFNFNDMGQSFTATADGELISVEVNLVLAISGSTLKVFQGNTVSGTPLYEQSGLSAGSGWQTIALSSPVPVVDGQQYTFQITDASLRYTFSDAYSGGNLWYNAISYTVFDAAFRASIRTVSGGNKALVEAMGSAPEVLVYPNPSRGLVQVQLGEGFSGGEIEITDVQGRILRTETFDQQVFSLDLKDVGTGMYWMRVSRDGRSQVVRLLIE